MVSKEKGNFDKIEGRAVTQKAVVTAGKTHNVGGIQAKLVKSWDGKKGTQKVRTMTFGKKISFQIHHLKVKHLE